MDHVYSRDGVDICVEICLLEDLFPNSDLLESFLVDGSSLSITCTDGYLTDGGQGTSSFMISCEAANLLGAQTCTGFSNLIPIIKSCGLHCELITHLFNMSTFLFS